MADTFTLQGSYSSMPCGMCSGTPSVEGAICEKQTLVGKQFNAVDLESDDAVSVPLTNIANASALVVKVVGGYVKVGLTFSDETTGTIIVDSFLSLLALAKPIASLTLTRQPGTPVQVQVFMGQAG